MDKYKVFKSYKSKKQKAIQAKCLNMRKAKDHKRLESPAPEYPTELSDHWAEITIKRCINGHIETETIFMDGIADNSYIAWRPETSECLGTMGLWQATREALTKFPRIRRFFE